MFITRLYFAVMSRIDVIRFVVAETDSFLSS